MGFRFSRSLSSRPYDALSLFKAPRRHQAQPMETPPANHIATDQKRGQSQTKKPVADVEFLLNAMHLHQILLINAFAPRHSNVGHSHGFLVT